jgi:hypothetical protein
VIALQEDMLEPGKRRRQEDIDDLPAVQASVDVVTHVNYLFVLILPVGFRIRSDQFVQLIQEICSAMNVSYCVKPVIGGHLRGRPRDFNAWALEEAVQRRDQGHGRAAAPHPVWAAVPRHKYTRRTLLLASPDRIIR